MVLFIVTPQQWYTGPRPKTKEKPLETPEIHTPHAHHGGGLPRWLELLIAITALITSISSIAIAVHHGHIMEKLVQANSFPYLQGGFSTATVDGGKAVALDFVNRGVGPAHEKSLRIKVKGTYVRSTKELIAAVLGPDQVEQAESILHPIYNKVQTRFIPGGQSQLVFHLQPTSDNASLFELLRNDVEHWQIEYCYCSVFDDCWQVLSNWQEPEPVKQCSRDEPHEFLP
jgi:hypothetical protein